MKIRLQGRGVTKGKAEGEAVVTKEPISFWGGLDRETGEIVDRNHELAGVNVTGKILIFPHGKGSTGGSRTLYASAKKGTAPSAIINIKAESIIATGAIVAGIPLVDRLNEDPISTIQTGDYVWVDADTGIVLVEPKEKRKSVVRSGSGRGKAMTRVGVIGTGRMGNAFALNLLKAGHEVYVYDAMPDATRNLVQEGAIRGETPADVGSVVDFLITSLPRSEIVEEVIIGRDGAKNRLRSGSVVIDMSTTHPRVTKRIAGELAKAGIDFLDAPVSGHAAGAKNATLTIMVGGKKEVFLKSKAPIFEKLGKNIFYAGPSGTGQALKLVNNLLYNLNRLAMCEGLVMGAKAGIDPEVLCKAVMVSTGASYCMANLPPDIFRGDFAGRESSLNLACKTLKLITDYADELQVPLLLGNMAQQIYNIVKLQGHGEDSPTSAITFYESSAGVDVRIPGK